jgi:hypothetical protein
MRKILALIGAMLVSTPAIADWTGKNAAGATVTFKNPGDCTSVVCVPMAQPYDGTNTITFTTAGADNVSNTQTGMPTYSRMQVFDGSTWDRWTGLVQAAQSGTWTVQPGNTANTTPWLMSISQGGNTAVVKAANTVASTDVGLVVAVANTLAPGQAAAASSSPVVVAKNSGTGSTVAGAAVGTAGTASAEVVTVQGVASMTPVATNMTQVAGSAISASNPLFARSVDGTRSAVIDPCEANVQSYATGVITSGTTTRIIAPSASNKTYLCAFFMKASAADNVGVVEGTGGTCGTGTAALIGGTTAANGFVFGTAGDGIMMQAGGKVAIVQTAGTNVDTCLITTTTGPLIWSAKYVQAP